MNPFALPEIWRFENYVKVWQKGGFDKYFLNSIFVTVIAMFFCSVIWKYGCQWYSKI